MTWVVEGDIHACFDNFDHHVLVELLRRRITDEAFISLIWKFLKAGYMEQWEYNCTYSGVPQGSLCRARHNPPYAELVVMPS